jgi:hypothetical protein
MACGLPVIITGVGPALDYASDKTAYLVAFWLGADDEVVPADRVKLLTLLAGLNRLSTGGMASGVLPVTPPLTRPAGDLSPGRGENQRPEPQAASALRAGSALVSRPHPRNDRRFSMPAIPPREPEDVPAAYVVRCACVPSPDGKKGAAVVDHVRLFPIRPGVRWAYDSSRNAAE